EPVTTHLGVAGARAVLDSANTISDTRTSVNLRRASAQARSERQAARKVGRAVDGPTADQKVGDATHVATPLFPPPERQVIHLGEDKDMVAVVGIGAVIDFFVDVVPVAVVVCRVLKGIAPLERKPAREPLFDGCLQRVIVVISVITEIVYILRPSEV